MNEIIYPCFDEAIKAMIEDQTNDKKWYRKNDAVEWRNFIKRKDGLYDAIGVLVGNGDYIKSFNITSMPDNLFSGEIYVGKYLMLNLVMENNSLIFNGEHATFQYHPLILCIKMKEPIFPVCEIVLGISKNKLEENDISEIISDKIFWVEDGRFDIVDSDNMILNATLMGGVDLLNRIKPNYIENIKTTVEKVRLSCNSLDIIDFNYELNFRIPTGKLIYSELELSGITSSDLLDIKLCFSDCNVTEPEKDIMIHISGNKFKLIRFAYGVIQVRDVVKQLTNTSCRPLTIS